MSKYHGKSAALYAWDGSNSALTDEACTESAATAQITDSAKRILDPNETQTFTDTGGKNVIGIDYTIGKATFDDTVTIVTATGKYVPAGNITEIGNLFSWSLETSVDLADGSVFGDAWKSSEAGQMKWSGGAEGYFLNSYWIDAQALLKMWLVKFYIDATKYFMGWCHIPGLSQGATISELVKESITIEGYKHMLLTVP